MRSAPRSATPASLASDGAAHETPAVTGLPRNEPVLWLNAIFPEIVSLAVKRAIRDQL